MWRSKATQVRRIVADRREEIAQLKGPNCHPDIRPGGIEKGTAPKPPRRGKSVPRVTVEVEIRHLAIPAESQFKGYDDFVVQDWGRAARRSAIAENAVHAATPIVATLPPGISSHHGLA